MSEFVHPHTLEELIAKIRFNNDHKQPLNIRVPIVSQSQNGLFVYPSDVTKPGYLRNKINTVKQHIKKEISTIKVTRAEVVDKDKDRDQYEKNGNLLIKWERVKPKAPAKPRAKKTITKPKVAKAKATTTKRKVTKPRASKQTKTTKAKSTKPAKTKKAPPPKKPRATKEPKLVETQVVAPIAPPPVHIPSVPEPVIVFDKPIAIRQTPLDFLDDSDYNPIKKLIKKKKSNLI